MSVSRRWVGAWSHASDEQVNTQVEQSACDERDEQAKDDVRYKAHHDTEQQVKDKNDEEDGEKREVDG